MRTRVAKLFGLSLLVVILLACTEQPAQVSVATVRNAKLVTSFLADAETKAISASASSRIVAKIERLLVREGARVKRGQIVAYLEAHDLQAAASEAAAAIRVAESDLHQANESVRAAEIAYASQVAIAETGVMEAEARLAAVKAGPKPTEIEAARHRVESLRAVMEEAKAAFDRAQTLFDQGVISKANLEQADSKAKLAGQQLEAAEDDLSTLIAGPIPEVIHAAEATVEVAKMHLEVARAGRADIELRKVSIELANARLIQAKSSAQRSKMAVEDRLIKSPLTGVVQKLFLEPGEIASPGVPILLVVDPKTLYVEAQVGDEDAAKVHLGQKLRITSASYPGRSFAGKVSQINASAERRPGSVTDRRILRVRIEIIESRQFFSPGMEIDVSGQSFTIAASLLIPGDAVVMEGGETYVWRVVGQHVEKVAVKVGNSNFAETEVFGRLKEGDRVVIRGKEGLNPEKPVRVK